ncbi:hypothetical protein Tsubulata_044054 [Turnera subulata]|uniref:Uncharacterized protein n=1 Tax=Turnera subulata TaxID=218843 RepID=A0A9Q0GM68_9ROSI|nr:hypothetical protein Tsubulata_044054 [Turnera subulata]
MKVYSGQRAGGIKRHSLDCFIRRRTIKCLKMGKWFLNTNFISFFAFVPLTVIQTLVMCMHYCKLCRLMMNQYSQSHNQDKFRASITVGLPTIRSFVAVGTGATKLVSLLVESYRKDHKKLKGMQRVALAIEPGRRRKLISSQSPTLFLLQLRWYLFGID